MAAVEMPSLPRRCSGFGQEEQTDQPGSGGHGRRRVQLRRPVTSYPGPRAGASRVLRGTPL